MISNWLFVLHFLQCFDAETGTVTGLYKYQRFASRTSDQFSSTKKTLETDLRKQHERHPLVVGDMPLHGAGLSWHRVRFRQVVRVGDPADAVGEGNVAVGEVSRRPAVDRRADVLRGADDDREHDQQDDRVAVVETVR